MLENGHKAEITDRQNEDEKHWPQILVILIGALSGLTEGLNISWTSPSLPKILENKENYDINMEQASLLNTIYPLGMLIGCPFFSWLNDKIGRKRTFFLTGIIQILGWIFIIFAKDIYLFSAARLCAGLSCGCYFSVYPVYIGEIANPTVRGSWGNAVASSMYAGQFLMNAVGSYCGIRTTAYIFLSLPVLFLILFSLVPESPYYSIMKGREQEAKNSLKFLTRKQHIDNDYLRLKSDVNRQISESASWGSLIKIKSNRKALIAGIFLRFTQQTSGLGIFTIYFQTIAEKFKGFISPQLSSIVYTAVTISLNFFMLSLIVHRFDRRLLYSMSLITTGITLYILGIFYFIDNFPSLDLDLLNWMPTTLTLIYQCCASFGISVIPTLMMSELYSASIKAKAMSLLLVLMSVGNIAVNSSFYYMIEYFGLHSPFLIYAVCNTVAVVLSYYLIPDTRGKTLEEIQQMLKGNKK